MWSNRNNNHKNGFFIIIINHLNRQTAFLLDKKFDHLFIVNDYCFLL